MQSIKFTTKFTLGLLIAAVVPLALGGYWLSVLNLSAIKSTSRELYLSIAQNIAGKLEYETTELTNLLLQTEKILNDQYITESSAVALVGNVLGNVEYTSAIGIYDVNGHLVDTFAKQTGPFQTPLPTVIPEHLLRKLASSQVVIATPTRFTPRGDAAVLPVLVRCSGERFTGVLMAVIDNAALRRLVLQTAAPTFAGVRGQVYLVDDSLRAVVHSDTNRAKDSESLAGKGIFKSEQQLSTSSYNVSGSVEYDDAAGEAMHGTFSSIAALNIGIVVEQPQSVAYKSVIQTRNTLFFWSIASAVIAGFVSIVVGRQFSKPITQLVSASRKFAEQDFSERLPTSRKDEFGVLFDVHNHVAAELGRYQKLNINEVITERNKFEAIARQASDGIIILSPTKKIMLVNDVFAGWFECEPAAVEGMGMETALTSDDLKTYIGNAFASEESLTPVELRFNRVGEVRETVLRGAMVKVVVDEALAALVYVLRDVSKEVEVDRMKTDLVSIVAHELRSPLNIIKGYSDMIHGQYVGAEEAIQFAGTISSQADRLNGVITKFLDISRIESGKTDIQQIPYRLHELVKAIISVNSRLAVEKKITLELALPATSAPIVGDPDLIGQVILNFLSNAVKYSEAEKKMRVVMQEREREMYFAVEDEGYGISESSQQKLFSKFFRATEDTRVQANVGTGLGLSFAKEIIEKHGGAIGVKSTINVGSTFWFTLPK